MKKEAIEMKRNFDFLKIMGLGGFLMCMVSTFLYKWWDVNNVKMLSNLKKIFQLTCVENVISSLGNRDEIYVRYIMR